MVFALIDVALLLGLLSLIFYILIAVQVFPSSLSGLSYTLLIIAIILFIVWIVLRFVIEFSNGGYNWRRHNNNNGDVINGYNERPINGVDIPVSSGVPDRGVPGGRVYNVQSGMIV